MIGMADRTLVVVRRNGTVVDRLTAKTLGYVDRTDSGEWLARNAKYEVLAYCGLRSIAVEVVQERS